MPPKRQLKKQTPRRPRARVNTVPRLRDSAAADHMQMIVDPCNAPLLPGVYGNSLPTQRIRFKRLKLNSHTPASTAGTYAYGIAFHPVLGAHRFRVTSSTTDWYLTTANLNWSPEPDLDSPFSSQPRRALGACLSFSWAGTELSRKGTISTGIVNGGMIWENLQTSSGGQGAFFTSPELASQLANQCRTPNDKCELTWVPSEADAEYREELTGVPSTDLSLAVTYGRTNFAVMMITCPQAVAETVAVEVKVVAIIENNLDTPGVVADAAHVPPNNSNGVTVTDIIRHLQKKDSSWYVDTFKKMGNLVGRGLSAYARGGALGLVSEVAGMVIAPRKNFSS